MKSGPKPKSRRQVWSQYVDIGAPDKCWLWKGRTVARGYGLFTYTDDRMPPGSGRQGRRQRDELGHRASYEMQFGEIPGGLHVLHRCDNPPCVNPAHLFLGTRSDNMRDAVAKGRMVSKLPPPRRGTANPMAKLTPDLVREIYLSNDSGYKIGARLGINQGTVSLIRLGRIWREVTQGLPTPTGDRNRTRQRGDAHHSAKLTVADVLAIRSSKATLVADAQRYGVSFTTIAKIKSRQTWSHIQ